MVEVMVALRAVAVAMVLERAAEVAVVEAAVEAIAVRAKMELRRPPERPTVKTCTVVAAVIASVETWG